MKVVNASFAYEKEFVLRDINVEIKKNALTGIIGPNGCGKTTLIKILTGILPLSKGTVYLEEKKIQSYSKKQLAKKISVLSQHVTEGFQFTVYEIVCLGRYAHQQGLFSHWSEEDERIVQMTMKQTGVTNLGDRVLETLSGGEKQRVLLAQCLAQQPDIIILDEPTNHLDIKYQIEVCELLRTLVTSEGITVICIFHDLNLASLFCDEMILMQDGQIIEKDNVNKILVDNNIKKVYHPKLKTGIHPKLPKQQIYINANQENFFDWKVRIYPEENLVVSNLDLKCLSTIEGIHWHKHFIFEEFHEIKEIKLNHPHVRVIIPRSNLRRVILLLLDGLLEEAEIIQLMVFISKNYQFDEIIIGTTLRDSKPLNLNEIKNIFHQKLEMYS